MWILIIRVTFQDTKLNLFLGKNRKLELQNEKTRKCTIYTKQQGREDGEICIYYYADQRKVFLGCSGESSKLILAQYTQRYLVSGT